MNGGNKMTNELNHLIDLFRSTPDDDIIRAWEEADKNQKNKEGYKKNEQTTSKETKK